MINFISLFLSFFVFAQSPPASVKGEFDSAFMLPKPNLVLPSYGATNLGGLNVRLETGNENRLINPSFEAPGTLDFWNTQDTWGQGSYFQDGKKSAGGNILGGTTGKVLSQDYLFQSGEARGTLWEASGYMIAGGSFQGANFCVASIKAGPTYTVEGCRPIPRFDTITDDKKIYFLSIPFVTPDDPTVLGFQWYIENSDGVARFIIVDNAYLGPARNQFTEVHLSAYAGSNQSIPDSTITTVIMDHIVERIGPISINTLTGVVTVQEAGLYLITGQVVYGSNNTGARHIYIRDVTNSVNKTNQTVPGSAADRPTTSKVVRLQAGQQVSIATYQNSGGALSTVGGAENSTFITVTKIGPYQESSNIADSVASGSYTPTTANPVNISSVTSTNASYIRIGKKVLVYGELINVATAASNTATSIELSVPIPPAGGSFVTNNQAYGSGAGYAGVNGTVAVRVRAANGTSRVMLNWNATYTTQSVITYSFMYDAE